MTADARKYGYFAIQRVHGGIATLPDGTKQSFDSYQEALKARSGWIEENALPEARKKAAEGREEFIAGCKVDQERIKQPGLLTPDVVRQRVLDPDGKQIANPTQQSPEEIIKLAAETKFPVPNVGGLSEKLAGKVEKTVVWAASLYLDGEPKHLPAFSYWTFGLPIESVLEVLNELAADGWEVVHVSEDRGIYSGTTNQTDSAVTKARYLLTRVS